MWGGRPHGGHPCLIPCARDGGPDGLLVLSGILDSQAYQVIAALCTHGLTVVCQEHIEDWLPLIQRKPNAA